jgi:4-hydroxybutyrate CoA-transferase
MNWKQLYNDKLITADEAAGLIKSGDVIAISNGTSMPVDVFKSIQKRLNELEDIKIICGLLIYPFDELKIAGNDSLKYYTVFMGPYERAYYNHGNVNMIINQFSKLHQIIKEKINNNIAVFECSEPDQNGYMSYGPMGSVLNHAFKENADTIIVQVNSKTPYLHGTDVHIHVSEVDYICEQSHELPDLPSLPAGPNEEKIANHIIHEISDGSTIQLGIGMIADAIGSLLEKKNDLGIHTEMLTNSMVDLVKKGVVNCRKKNFHKDKIVMSFAMGNKQTLEFMHHNPMIEARPVFYVNDPRIIGQNDNFISINATLAVDLTGQICSESLGFRQYSGTGGQLDFVRGAKYSKGGKSFIALNAVAETKNGPVSKICCSLPPGSVVTVPRSDAQFIVTEYGIAELWGKTIPDRVEAMISIAHPEFREKLREEARSCGLFV